MAIEMSGGKRDLSKHKFMGLQERARTVLKCSACLKPLLTLLSIDATLLTGVAKEKVLAQKARYKAKCCYCEDASYPVELTGKVVVEDGEFGVQVIDMEDRNGVSVFLTQKKEG